MTSFYNFFRKVFKIRLFEITLARFTQGQRPTSLICKLVPNPYQYPKPSYRHVKRHGVYINVDISDYIGHYIYFGFKDASQEALFSLCKRNYFVMDIGTNIGYSLLRMASLANQGQLAGFEPDPINYKSGIQNIALNPQIKNLTLYNVGLGDSVTEAEIEVRTPGNRGANRITLSNGSSAKVSITKLDLIFSSFNWSQLNLIKLDVEGYEVRVLKGAEATLKKYYPILFIEVNDSNLRHQQNSAKELILFLFYLGYNQIQNAVTGQPVTPHTDLTEQHVDIIATREEIPS